MGLVLCRLIVPACMFLFVLPVCAQSPEKVIYVGANCPPYLVGEIGGEATSGMALDIVTKIFSEMGVTVESQIVPWSRAIGMMERGRSDILFPVKNNNITSEFLEFTAPVFYSKGLVFYAADRNPKFRWGSYRDFSRMTVGLLRKDQPGIAFENAAKTHGINVVRLADAAAVFKLINLQRLDFTIMDDRFGRSILDQQPLWKKNIHTNSKPVYEVPVYIGISKKSAFTERLDQINRLIQKMQKSGQILGILGHS